MTMHRSGWAAAALAALLLSAAPAAADTGDAGGPGEAGFLGALDAVGFAYPDPAGAVAGGHEVCRYLAEGHSANQAAKGVKNANPGLTLTRAAQFVAVARANLCADV